MSESTTEIYCDIFTCTVRLCVPPTKRFLAENYLSHPTIRATTKLISKRLVWTSMDKDVLRWIRSLISFQRVKIQRRTNSEPGHFEVPDA
ncbi:hypothetical protein TNCV_1199411 [Trichonephila clavipes]|uniref:Integrase zinc-binding domain-containing protein n=1 Tax=Trichonephila clavipes TaxID=2585209 RepID=A0A8X6VDR2_TRICX|nr:hypothetical protein TNCV_1199411 [Trichonephila clavipes]